MSEPATSMRVIYTYEFADYQALVRIARSNALVRAHNRKWCSSLPISIIISCAIPLSISMTWWTRSLGFYRIEPFSMLLGMLLLYSVFIGLSYATAKPRMKSLFMLSRNAGKRIIYELSSEGISFEMGASRGVSGWEDIIRVTELPSHLMLSVSATDAYALPRRAFASDADFTAAISFAKERVQGQTS